MSWRPRGGASRRGRSAVTRPIYEDFKPTYEWMHEDGASIMLYYLPGFSKEQIRIIAESKGVLKVRGERLIANNKWSRFQEEVVVPEDCNMSEVRAKFEGGNLRITMPKKTSTTTVDKKHPPSEDQRRPMNTALQGRGPPRSSVTTPSSVQPNKPQLHELQEEMSSKPTTTLPPTIAPKLPQFGTTGIISPPTLAPSIGSQSEPQPKRQQEAAPTTLPMRLPPIDTLKQPKPYYQDNVYDKTNEKLVEDRRFHEEDYPTRIVGSKGAESVGRMAPTSHFRENEIKHKHKNDEATHHHGIQEEKHETYVDALDQERESKYDLSKMNNNNKYDSYKQVMKTRLSKKSLDEDRKLLVNMGVAILVILALGASISYSLSSSE